MPSHTTAFTTFHGRALIAGQSQGELLHADVGLSFWGGVDPATGEIIDRHHPLSGRIITDRILAIPSGRGSCTGSSVMLELILSGHAPAGLLLEENDDILVLGVLVAERMFGRSIPIIACGAADFERLRHASHVRLDDGLVEDASSAGERAPASKAAAATPPIPQLALTQQDRAMLDGEQGRATQVAMEIVVRMAELQGAEALLDITQAHIDGCIYTGPACLRFAETLVEWGGRVQVHTTLNAISVDQRRWRELGVDPAFGEPASALGDAYLAMGAQATFTCAPYLLDSAPVVGEQIVWAESNAVVYANSVLGARTMKYPDYLDICIALTGRAPLAGCHLSEQRLATLQVEVSMPPGADDAFYPLLGYQTGLICGQRIPVICGLEHSGASRDALKAFGAAFATTSAAPMFHIAGITPEAGTAEQALGHCEPGEVRVVGGHELLHAWHELNSATTRAVGLISLGNPHFSLGECAMLAALCDGRSKHPAVAMVITCGRAVHEQAREAGHVDALERFGARFVTDTCWCMLSEPIVPPGVRTLMTNSGKYAHYAPGLVGRQVHFGSLAECVDAAETGQAAGQPPAWLIPQSDASAR